MTRNTRTALMACIAALSLGLALAPGSAQDKPGTMGKDTMSKGGDTMAKDKSDKDMAKDAMKKEEKKDMMKKDEMKK